MRLCIIITLIYIVLRIRKDSLPYMRRLNETLAKVVDDCGYH